MSLGERQAEGSETAGDPEAWVGRQWTGRDVVTPRLAAAFSATLAPRVAQGRTPPPGIFWCLAPDIVPADGLGADGHPRPGLSLPDTGLPRRMWAGGELVFHGDFAIGDVVEKVTRVESVTRKVGRSGPLAFVTLQNAYSVSAQPVLTERQDIVYREATSARSPSPAPPTNDENARLGAPWPLATTPTLLFRYSALTFNGHRIHYDADYARDVEGYGGLVVHGPLLATVMLNLAVERVGSLPRRFAYRGVAPLVCGTPALVEALAAGEKTATRVTEEGGGIVAEAIADFGKKATA